MKIKCPCLVCGRSLAKNHRALQCDFCDKWVHIKCNLIDKKTYEMLKLDETPWSCINCTEDIFPFINTELTTKQ